MSTSIGTTPQGPVVSLGIPDSEDFPRLVYCAPYFTQVPLAELIEPSVQESVEALLPSLVPPYVNNAAEAAVQQLAVLLTGSTMSGPLMLAPLMPTADSMAATKAYVDAMVATAGVPEVPPVPSGQIWARQTGQWVPISEQEGTFLPLAGGTMQGQIGMSGYAINNLAALPNMPNGAAPANWVLQQIASVSLYQGTWNMDTYTPDLTNPNTHVNGYTWIAITTSTSGVVIGPAIPGLQGQTVFNGDTIIWSNIQGQFNRIHSGGLSLAEAQALFLPFTGGTMTGPLLAFENPTAAMEVATMGWVESLLPSGGVIPDAPTDGQLYGRNGLTKAWLPVLPLAGGIMTGPITLSGNATNALNPVPLQQMQSTLSATYLALAGGTMTGPMVLSGNASANLNPVPLQQVNSMLSGFLPISGGTLTGPLTLSANAASALQAVTLQQMQAADALRLLLTGGTLTGPLTLSANAAAALQPVTLQQLQGGYLPLTGGTLTGALTVNSNVSGANFYATAGNVVLAASGISTAPAFTQTSTGNLAIWALSGGALTTVSIYGGTIDLNGNSVVNGSLQMGNLFPVANNVYNCGLATNGWASVQSYYYSTLSDIAFKRDIEPLPECTPILLALNPKRFKWNNAAADDPHKDDTHWGFIAQDVQQAMAGFAFGGHRESEGGQTISPDELVSVLWKACQEVAARVQTLETASGITLPAAGTA